MPEERFRIDHKLSMTSRQKAIPFRKNIGTFGRYAMPVQCFHSNIVAGMYEKPYSVHGFATSRVVNIQNTLAARPPLLDLRAVVQLEGGVELRWGRLVPKKVKKMGIWICHV